MIKLDNRGRRANNEELAQVFHDLNLGDMVNVYGDTNETIRLANSLSRTHKAHNKTRFMVHKKKLEIYLRTQGKKLQQFYILMNWTKPVLNMVQLMKSQVF